MIYANVMELWACFQSDCMCTYSCASIMLSSNKPFQQCSFKAQPSLMSLDHFVLSPVGQGWESCTLCQNTGGGEGCQAGIVAGQAGRTGGQKRDHSEGEEVRCSPGDRCRISCTFRSFRTQITGKHLSSCQGYMWSSCYTHLKKQPHLWPA